MNQRAPRRPLPGRQPLSREFIVSHQRARIIAALAEEAAATGYRAVSIADIVRRAGIARNTFYENFPSKESCFLAAQEAAIDEVSRRVIDASTDAETWERSVASGLAAFLSYVAEQPALARTCIVEALSAGDAARQRHERSFQFFVRLFRVGRERSPSSDLLPDTLEALIVGGLLEVLYKRIAFGEIDQIGRLQSELTDFALAPYVAAESAQRTLAPL